MSFFVGPGGDVNFMAQTASHLQAVDDTYRSIEPAPV